MITSTEKVLVLWRWQGGKARLAPWIANRLPPHRVYGYRKAAHQYGFSVSVLQRAMKKGG